MELSIIKSSTQYIKVWNYLLLKAQHKEYKSLKRGQLYTSIPEIQEACSWYIGYRKVTPSKSQIYQIIDWLRKPNDVDNEADMKTSMMTTMKATHGMLINIENYNIYQEPNNYESNEENDNEDGKKALRKQRHNDNTNKNGNNGKNGNVTKNFDTDSKEYKLSKCLSEFINTNLGQPLQKEKVLQDWAAEFDLMVRKDVIDIDEMLQVLIFSQNDKFWKYNILSAAKFRKQYLQLLGQMRRGENEL